MRGVLSGPGRQVLQIAHGGSVVRPRRRSRIISTPITQTMPTPFVTWVALPVVTAALAVGDWVRVIPDSNGAGSGGFRPVWAQWNGATFDGSYPGWTPATSTGFYEAYHEADVTFSKVGSLVEPPWHLYVEKAESCEIIVEDAACFGPTMRMRDVVNSRIIVRRCSGSLAVPFDVPNAELSGCFGNEWILEDVDAPGAVMYSSGSQYTVIKATDVRGLELVHDAGVCYIAGRDTMTRRARIQGEFLVNPLAAGLAGTQKRNRIYIDDFSSYHTVGPLTLTADSGDTDVNIGGGSGITVLTAGTHFNENRSAFTVQYDAWFPGGPVTGWIPPLDNTGQNTIAT